MKDYLNCKYNFDSDDLIEVLDETPFWSAPFGLKLLDGIELKKGLQVLDIGFGTGFPLTEIAMRLDSTSTVFGLDPWAAAEKRAKKKIAYFGISNVELLDGVAENIPLKDKSIDCIISNNGLNNVQDLQKALSECCRVLKNGRQFIQTVNLNETMIEFYSELEKALSSSLLDSYIPAIHEHIYKKRKPLDEYQKMIESEGFSIDSVQHDKFEYRFVDGTTMFNHFFIKLAFLDSWKNLVPTEKQNEIFSKVEDALNEKAKTDGFIKLSVPFVVIDAGKA